MDKHTILAVADFARARLLGILDTIEKSGQDTAKVLAWRPGPGRAHIAWQAMHCAATHDRYLNGLILGKPPTDEALVGAYGGGSTPSDENVPSLATIRDAIARHYATFRAWVEQVTPDELARKHKLANGNERSVGESLILLAWHEGHHQGQIHLTWNLYKSTHGMK